VPRHPDGGEALAGIPPSAMIPILDRTRHQEMLWRSEPNARLVRDGGGKGPKLIGANAARFGIHKCLSGIMASHLRRLGLAA
jgi:hypothetical protein